MAVEMTRAEMRTMIAGMKLAHAVVAGEDPDSQLAKALDGFVKRLSSTGKLTREESEKIRDAVDGYLNRHDDRLRKVIRDEIQIEIEDAQIKKTTHPSLPVPPTPMAKPPMVPRVAYPQNARSSFTPKPRGEWSKPFDDFYETVETSMYVPDPAKVFKYSAPVEKYYETFFSWAYSQRAFARFFNENRTLVLIKGVRLWRDRFHLAPVTLKEVETHLDAFFAKHLPHIDRTPPKKRGTKKP